MGKKINPKILRIGTIRTWPSVWFGVGDDYISKVKQDIGVRRYLFKNFKEAGIDKTEIERGTKKIVINIFTGKPGMLIGRGGAGIEDLKNKIHRKFLKNFRPGEIEINIKEVSRPNLSAQIVLQSMIIDIEKRVPFRKVMKQAIGRIEKAGAEGVKVQVGGRLNGAEIARTEKLVKGRLPLNTIRADIDYSRGWASTTYGSVGIKVWIYKGEVFSDKNKNNTGEVIKKNV
ncbi:30S ribosomal protein S3 [bacterium]|nr:30S ribosomal protein S3 [bacterium]